MASFVGHADTLPFVMTTLVVARRYSGFVTFVHTSSHCNDSYKVRAVLLQKLVQPKHCKDRRTEYFWER